MKDFKLFDFLIKNKFKSNHQETITPSKKPSNVETTKVNFDLIKDSEQVAVRSLVESFKAKETSLLNMSKAYLTGLALNYDKQWLIFDL